MATSSSCDEKKNILCREWAEWVSVKRTIMNDASHTHRLYTTTVGVPTFKELSEVKQMFGISPHSFLNSIKPNPISSIRPFLSHKVI